MKRQTGLPIIFILAHGSQQAQLAARNGFPVYQSMDTLLDALNIGQIARMRTAHSPRPSRPLDTSNTVRKEAGSSRKEDSSFPTPYSPRTTKPIFPDEHNEEEQQASNGREQIQPVEAYSPPTSTVWDSPLHTHDEQAQQKQGANHITQQFTPIPQMFIPEEDAEEQEAFSDPYRTGFPDAKDKLRHNTGNIWPSTRINISYRNTGPLASRNVEVGQGPTQPLQPSTPSIEQASERDVLGAGQGAVRVGFDPTGSLRPPMHSLVQYPMTDRRNLRENLTPLPMPPDLADSHGTMPNMSSGFALGGRKSRLYILLCVLVIAAISSLLVLPHFLNGAASTPPIDGHLVFTSSGQVSETSSQGIEDQVTLDLTSLAVPATGKALYAWLLGDKKSKRSSDNPAGEIAGEQWDGPPLLSGRFTTHQSIIDYEPGAGNGRGRSLHTSRSFTRSEYLALL